ncbi:MAG: hypothetical protein LBS16_07255 [Prevotellaceae bacterium]|jgi:hypothetical protein|nr:hypothetical protein [Prevotellaceae bacterium]
MKLIADHIEQLLERHTCVIVPAVGGFVTRMVSAEILDDTIVPPHREIGFNPALLHDDGLLVEALMQSQNISYLAAQIMLTEHISRMKRQLHRHGELHIGQIGTLKIVGQHIDFIPTDAPFLPENIGLKPLSVNRLPAHTTPAGIYLKNKRTLVISLPASQTSVLRYAAGFALVIALSFFTPPQSHNRQQAGFLPTSSLSPVHHQRPLQTLTDTDTVAVVTPDTIQTPPVMPVTKTHTRHFYLIIASLKTQAEAEIFCRNFKVKSGDTLQILSPLGGENYRISLNTFDSRSQAITAMNTVRSSREDLSRAWLLVR